MNFSVVAIPSHFSNPKNPSIIKHWNEKEKKSFENSYLEEELHFALNNALKGIGIRGLVIMGFYTDSLIKPNKEKASGARKKVIIN